MFNAIVLLIILVFILSLTLFLQFSRKHLEIERFSECLSSKSSGQQECTLQTNSINKLTNTDTPINISSGTLNLQNNTIDVSTKNVEDKSMSYSLGGDDVAGQNNKGHLYLGNSNLDLEFNDYFKLKFDKPVKIDRSVVFHNARFNDNVLIDSDVLIDKNYAKLCFLDDKQHNCIDKTIYSNLLNFNENEFNNNILKLRGACITEKDLESYAINEIASSNSESNTVTDLDSKSDLKFVSSGNSVNYYCMNEDTGKSKIDYWYDKMFNYGTN